MLLVDLKDKEIFIFKEKRLSPFRGQMLLNSSPDFILHSDRSYWWRATYLNDEIVKMRVK